ncbi:ADP-ribosylation factor-like protein 2-binding protein [Musca domestica]|uniref:ADP-ribosylation factor-like protein 2-binding protein n=1 Tax=Musca domestica TaxID=7370 RepID=A0A9J7CRK0_MUSDO|nr:ADP-ribosylation factor-like protein 2-binding protein [Musca domestica]
MDSPTEHATNIEIVGITRGSEFFDEVIGHIEDIVLSEEFQQMQEEFLEQHWNCFETGEENKLEYMDIFEEYSNKFESHIMQELQHRMDDFNMEKFVEELSSYDSHQDPYGFGDSEIFELLQSFSDFQTFKDLMLDYRSRKEGHVPNLEFDILITTPLR